MRTRKTVTNHFPGSHFWSNTCPQGRKIIFRAQKYDLRLNRALASELMKTTDQTNDEILIQMIWCV